MFTRFRAETRALIRAGGGGEYSYLCVLLEEFQLLLNSFQKKFVGAEREDLNIQHPHINTLVSALHVFIPHYRLIKISRRLLKLSHSDWLEFTLSGARVTS